VKLSVNVDEALAGDVDLEAVLKTVPKDTTLKGMFLSRYVNAIGEDWEDMAEDLVAPPRHGRYTAFEDYPLTDYLRLLDRAARNRFPRASTREAYRLLGRGDVEVFADSTLGKVTFSLLRDPGAALERYCEMIGVLTRGTLSGEAKKGTNEVTLTFGRYVGALEATIGCLEALVQTFDGKPTIDVTHEPPQAVFVVKWSLEK